MDERLLREEGPRRGGCAATGLLGTFMGELTFEYGTDLPDPRGPFPVVLSQSQLHVEERHARYHHEEEVGHQERTCTHERESSIVGKSSLSVNMAAQAGVRLHYL